MAFLPRAILPRNLKDSNVLEQPGPISSNDFRRKRPTVVKVACRNCQLRRAKCDGMRPRCQACTNRNTECQYDIGLGLTRTAALKERVESLQSQNSIMLQIFDQLRTRPKEEVLEFLELIRTDHDFDIGSMQDWIRDKRWETQGVLSPNPQIGSSNISSDDTFDEVISEILGHDLGQSGGPAESSSAASIDPSNPSDRNEQYWVQSGTTHMLSLRVDMCTRLARKLFYGERDVEESYIIQMEMVKVIITKSRIISSVTRNDPVSESNVKYIRTELRSLHDEMPEWMAIGRLHSGDTTITRRLSIYYHHLLFLSAMQLLQRRVMASLKPTRPESEAIDQDRNTAIREGLMAAKMAARVLSLLREEERFTVKPYWMFKLTSYTTGIVLLQAAIQKILNGYPSSGWIADLTLVDTCVETLHFFQDADEVAERLNEILKVYLEVIRNAVGGELNEDCSKDNDESEGMEYLFIIGPGTTNVHRAARDLFRLIQRPFDTSLDLVDAEGAASFEYLTIRVNAMEAALGTTLEWMSELQDCGVKVIRDTIEDPEKKLKRFEAISRAVTY